MPAVSIQKSSTLSTTIDHPKLLKTDAESVRVFLRLYDQYVNEVRSRAQQLGGDKSAALEIARPVNLKFCVDAEFLESAISLGFIPGATSYEELDEKTLRTFFRRQSRGIEKDNHTEHPRHYCYEKSKDEHARQVSHITHAIPFRGLP